MKTNLLQKNIPKGWEINNLSNLAVIKKGEQLNRLAMDETGEYPALNGGINPSGYTDKWNIEANTITISEGGNSCGYVNFNKERFWCGGHCYAIINLNENIDNNFLYQALKSKQDQIMKLRVGSGLPNIQKRSIDEFQLLFPELKKEQQKIAEILETVDENIVKTEGLIEATEKLKRGLMHELLTGQKQNGTWKSKRLEDIATISRGGSPRPIESYLTDDSDGLNWLRIGDIDVADKYIYRTTDKIKQEGLKKTTQVQNGDLILSNSMSFGRPYIMKIDACIHDGWLAFKNISKEIKTEYLYYILSSDKIQNTFHSLAMGSGVKNLKRESVSSIEIKFPEIEKQNKILTILSTADEKISINKRFKEKLIILKKGLMQDLLSGNVRVNI